MIMAKYSSRTLWEISTMFAPISAHAVLTFAMMPFASCPTTVITAFIAYTSFRDKKSFPYYNRLPKKLQGDIQYFPYRNAFSSLF
jgi:hypothetical protein